MQIQDKAVLVKLSIGMPGNSRKDKRITGQTIAQHHLGDKSGRWMKTLYPEEAFEPIAKIVTQARTYHYEQTLPWTDEGFRLLPTANHSDYCAAVRKYRQDFEQQSESHFIGRLSEWEQWARQQHNGTFNASDYLTADKLRRKFAFTSEFSPVPSGADFRLTINADEQAAMAQQVDERVAAAVQAAQQDLWARLAAPLRAMVVRFEDNPGEITPIFRDSLIGNIAAITELIPRLNLAADPMLSSLSDEVRATLATLKPAMLRASLPAREQAKAKAQAILDKMSAYLPQAA